MSPLLEKLKRAKARLDASTHQILQPGEYGFAVCEASMKHDNTRGYDYLFVRLDCDGKTTSDRFPIVDNMLWKLVDLLSAVGVDVDSFEPKALTGRTGKLIATKEGSATYYRYLAKEETA